MEELPKSLDSWQVEGLDDDFLDLAFGADWNPGLVDDFLANTKPLDEHATDFQVSLVNAHFEYSQDAARDNAHHTTGINDTTQHLVKRQHQATPIVQPAVRFSPASIKILKTWLSTHSDNPYPRVEEVEAFQRQTNLSKQQIMTWFANARRRSKNINIRKSAARDRSSSPIPFTPSPGRSTHGAVIGDQMDPFQRWTNSPPDQEPAEMSAIARAVASSLVVHDQEDSLATQGASPRIHNWQRHEKSLHLSLERWECSPDGPIFRNAHFEPACVYCGVVEGFNMDAHLQSHNYEACHIRTPEERTFYRKDHLRQHLRLIHQVQLEPLLMKSWKTEVMEVRSRCGFCSLALSTWTDRVDHLAEHFKNGMTMADWEGDWGFEPRVLEMVENSIAPYIIDYERNSPCPFVALQTISDGPSTAFELLQLETEYFCSSHINVHHTLPSNQELQYELCCIILASEILSRDTISPASSWVRDLLMSSEHITRQAKSRPIRSGSRFTDLRTHGQENIFGSCHMEGALQEYVKSMTTQGADVTNELLQQQACNIIWSLATCSSSPSDMLANLLVNLTYSSTSWLITFRERAGLPPAYPEHEALQTSPLSSDVASKTRAKGCVDRLDVDTGIPSTLAETVPGPSSDAAPLMRSSGFVDDSYYRRLIRELTRFISSAISPRNPNRHVPTDLEIQNQARWILYDCDDPWNQTPADNENWLKDFKDSISMPKQ
ncbi:conserved hypothetical protein [Verticillium alfalfae VaMs.102]|uniref:Homeobox domain-containing protein n=1 Tax=Verticillium alfalfae (strain VaMs.102 / ATCC MYA-4576 / FGSC 10136) TaxID=526221 RepID=C9S9V6_VERA1|nr:conserved hypothetical protein [Verticillium alfalfae VaMs.102]EEY16169.1 conserved hypothetical protein [Verticillium alfalfae VaMs.102]